MVNRSRGDNFLKSESEAANDRISALQMETQLEVKGKNDKELYELDL